VPCLWPDGVEANKQEVAILRAKSNNSASKQNQKAREAAQLHASKSNISASKQEWEAVLRREAS
jgi:hypothetical protein